MLHTITPGVFSFPTFLHETKLVEINVYICGQHEWWGNPNLLLSDEHQDPFSDLVDSNPCSWLQDFLTPILQYHNVYFNYSPHLTDFSHFCILLFIFIVKSSTSFPAASNPFLIIRTKTLNSDYFYPSWTLISFHQLEANSFVAKRREELALHRHGLQTKLKLHLQTGNTYGWHVR